MQIVQHFGYRKLFR